MTSKSIDQVLTALVDLLEQHGESDHANWLRERQAVLNDPDATGALRENARADLYSIINGVGGLNDLWLEPPKGSTSTRLEIRKQLRDLTERLWELTRSS